MPETRLADGRYPAFLTAIDVPGRTITVDVIQYLTGEEAERAYREDHPEDPDGPPNPFYIRNQNPWLRTLPVRRRVNVDVIWLGGTVESESIPFEQLPAYFAGDPVPYDPYVWHDPFWLTVRNGRVDAMAELYLP